MTQELTTDELYSKSLDELNKLCLDRGIRFNPTIYPYHLEEFRTSGVDILFNYKLEDSASKFELGIADEQKYTIYNIVTCMGVFRRYWYKKNALEAVITLNKRNRICMYQSENPEFPVYL